MLHTLHHVVPGGGWYELSSRYDIDRRWLVPCYSYAGYIQKRAAFLPSRYAVLFVCVCSER